MKSPAVSVIVPVYKVEAYLDRCVESILRQTFSDMQVLLVDDGSPDACGSMCDSYAAKDSRVQVIHKANGGLSDARNAGFEASTGEYVLFIDSDDYIEPTMVEVLYRLVQTHNADIACCGIANCYETGRFPQYALDEEFTCSGKEALREVLIGARIPGGIVDKLIRRDVMGSHRFLKGKTYEDAFFTPGLLLNAQTVAVTTQSLYNYWHRSGSITTQRFNPRAMDVIDAYLYTLDIVRERCPEMMPAAQFRVHWAHFVVLDRMLEEHNYHKLPQYPAVRSYLKKTWWAIVKDPYFQKSRKIAAVALKINIRLYALLSRMHQQHERLHP